MSGEDDELNYINNGQKLFSKGGKKSKPKKILKMKQIKLKIIIIIRFMEIQ